MIAEKQTNRFFSTLYGVIIFLFFLSILLSFITELAFRQALYYTMIVLCFMALCLWKIMNHEKNEHIRLLAFILICFTFGVLNILFIGNSSYTDVLECALFSVLVALFIIKTSFHPNWILVSVYMYCTYFIIRLLMNGIGARLLDRYSNNYVSIILLLPTVVYYSLCEIKGLKISFVPAFLVWIISLLAAGRSGIISMTLLYLIVFFVSQYYNNNGQHKLKAFLRKLFLTIIIGIAVYSLFSLYSGTILWKFNNRGIVEAGRTTIWSEYLQLTKSNPLYIFLGTPKQGLIMQEIFDGNTHNSFINIHANNGIIVLVVLFILIRSAIFGIKNRRWIYLGCLSAFCIRSFFDNVFWGTKGTFVFMFLLLYPYYQ